MFLKHMQTQEEWRLKESAVPEVHGPINKTMSEEGYGCVALWASLMSRAHSVGCVLFWGPRSVQGHRIRNYFWRKGDLQDVLFSWIMGE